VLVTLASLYMVLSMRVVAAGVRFGRREDVVLERNFPTTGDLLITNSLGDKIVAVDMNASRGRHFFRMIGITYHRVLSLRTEVMITT
jgi:hypothetical protein